MQGYCLSSCSRCPGAAPAQEQAQAPAATPAQQERPSPAPEPAAPAATSTHQAPAAEAAAPPPTAQAGCDDTPPDTQFTCQQQQRFGKCNEPFMLQGNYCAATCGRCTSDGAGNTAGGAEPGSGAAPAG